MNALEQVSNKEEKKLRRKQDILNPLIRLKTIHIVMKVPKILLL